MRKRGKEHYCSDASSARFDRLSVVEYVVMTGYLEKQRPIVPEVTCHIGAKAAILIRSRMGESPHN